VQQSNGSILREGISVGEVIALRIMCRDTEGYWDGAEWNGEHARLFAIREINEAAAEKKLLAHKAE
jgi:hypothetical protein